MTKDILSIGTTSSGSYKSLLKNSYLRKSRTMNKKRF